MTQLHPAEPEKTVPPCAYSMNALNTQHAYDRQTLAILRHYTESLSVLAVTESRPDLAQTFKDLLPRLDCTALSVAVVGEFKRGKSTFINALLGHPLLPADVKPTTAVMTRIRHGTPRRAFVRFRDGREEPIDPNRLADYVTQLTDIVEAVVTYPLPFCGGVQAEFIDTPGLNDTPQVSPCRGSTPYHYRSQPNRHSASGRR